MAEFDWGNFAAQSMPALGSLLTSGASIADTQARADAALSNMDSVIDTYNYQQDTSRQAIDDINRAASDKMTDQALDTMVREARLRTASAETGTSGGTTTSVVKDTRMQQSLNNAMTIRQARNSKIGILQGMETNKLNMRNSLESISSNMTSPLAAGLATASAGMSGYSSGLNYMNNAQRETFFGYDNSFKYQPRVNLDRSKANLGFDNTINDIIANQ